MGCQTSKIGPNPALEQSNDKPHHEEEKVPINQSSAADSTQPLTRSSTISPDQPLRSILKGSGGVKKDWEAIRAKKGLTSNAAIHHEAADQQPQTMFSNTITVAQPQEQSIDEPLNASHNQTLKQPNHAKHARIRSSSSTLRTVEVIDIRHERAPSHTPSATTNEPPPKRAQSIHTENQSINQSAATFTSASSVKPAHKKKKRRTSHKGLMSRLALQFPVIRRSLIAVYAAYQQFIDHHQKDSMPSVIDMQTISQCTNQNIPALSSIAHIDSHQLKGVLEHLTNRSRAFTEAQVQELFDLAHLHSENSENAKLSFRECLIAIALGYYLSDHPEPSAAEDPNFTTIAQGFKVIRQAFLDMDDDDSGKLDKNELKQALFAASSMNSKSSLLEDRFAELDFNSDGDVELKEFIYGVVSWVNLTSDEEQEDIEQQS